MVIDKAITSCQKAGYEPSNHFAGIIKKVVERRVFVFNTDRIIIVGHNSSRTDNDMNRFCIFMGMIVFGWIGWWIGARFGGFMTSFVISSIGSIVGVYVGWRINRDYLS